MRVDENGLKWMKMDEVDKVDTNGRKWMKMEDTGWEMAESG